MDLGIEGHTVVVTGGGRGIGEAVCKVLAQDGCGVAVCDKDVEAAGRVAAEIRASGGRAAPVQGDVTDRQSVAARAKEVRKELGAVRILVNNAGFSRDRPFLEMTDEDWDVMMNVCLRGVFLCTQAFLPDMVEAGYGRVINIASRAHLGGEPLKTAYSAAKGGVVSFTKALSVEFGKKGVTVNAVAPGFTQTERLLSLPNVADIERRALEGIHAARLGTPEDMARADAYLASAQSGVGTGEGLYVPGGRYGCSAAAIRCRHRRAAMRRTFASQS